MARKTAARRKSRPPRRRALLVGINGYRDAPLKGCVNDALMVGQLLIEHFGFHPGGDMRLLVDARATKRAILERLEWLVDGARAGDVLVFHYSGHGAQVPDRSGDEVDSTDECLCPIDFNWDDPLIDDDLEALIEGVPEEANLTLILDCCHSGTMTRAFGPPSPAAVKRLVAPPDIRFRAVSDVAITPGEDYFSVTMKDFRPLRLNRFGASVVKRGILVAGCRSDQLSKDALIESDYHGALTYSLYQSIRRHGPNQSYRDWLQSSSSILHDYQVDDQDPQLECPEVAADWRLFQNTAATAGRAPRRRAGAAADRHVVYVHGICRHDAGYSDPWWQAMAPHVPSVAGGNRHEVLWSRFVTPSARALRARSPAETELAEMIRDTLADRSRRQLMEATISSAGAAQGFDEFGTRAFLGIPGLDCVDDFAKYLLSTAVRNQVIQSFLGVVQPLLARGRQLEIISHSWGTVVAYEALCRLDGHPGLAGGVRTLFTVGSALSIGPVKALLEPGASDGRKPRLVQRWVNLDARFDIVGGPMKGAPFAVDDEFLQLDPVGCSSVIPNPACAHSSYFRFQNSTVNRDIFGRFIER